jgi:hypothetical protein
LAVEVAACASAALSNVESLLVAENDASRASGRQTSLVKSLNGADELVAISARLVAEALAHLGQCARIDDARAVAHANGLFDNYLAADAPAFTISNLPFQSFLLSVDLELSHLLLLGISKDWG